jgi:hypothetical protein
MKFKVGDIVECIDPPAARYGINKGGVYTIVGIREQDEIDYIVVRTPYGISGRWHPRRFILYSSKNLSKNKVISKSNCIQLT